MYSPRIDVARIPRISRRAQALNRPMAWRVNQLLEYGVVR